MQIFKAFDKIGVTHEQLTNIGNEDIIRIEKKLVAESRLNEELTKNDIARIIKLLKDYPDVLHWLCYYQCLHGILIGVDAAEIDTVKRHPAAEAERIRQAISVYFYDDILVYINLNFNTANWNNLRVLVHYKELLPLNVLSFVFQKLQDKVDFAYNELKRNASNYDLEKNSGFLTSKDFFMLLSDVDLKYFERYMMAIATFLKQNRTRFKDSLVAMVAAMRYFDGKNLQLDYALRSCLGVPMTQVTYQPRTRSPWGILAGILLTLISFARTCSGGSTSTPVNISQDDNYASSYIIQQQKELNETINRWDTVKINMERFVEARTFSLNYPLKSWKAAVIKPAKYANPFASDIFQNNNIGLRHDLNSLNIFNNTHNECIAIAYYKEYYDIYAKQYKAIENDYPPFIHAIYIPAGDSIKIDCRMSFLRFYMGRSLQGFNTYRNKAHADSLDVKFARFTPADSLLFSRPFNMRAAELNKRKSQSIIITQPSTDSYQIAWKGAGNLQQYEDNNRRYTSAPMDSATNKTPLVLRVMFPQEAVEIERGPNFDSYILRGEN